MNQHFEIIQIIEGFQKKRKCKHEVLKIKGFFTTKIQDYVSIK